MSKIIGIDLGTTYSAIASLNDLGTPEVLEDPIQNKKTIPSVVFLKGNNNVEVGENAKRMLSTNPDLTVSEVKKRMHEEVIWSTKEGKWIEKDTGKTKVTEGEFTPAQLSSFILKKVSIKLSSKIAIFHSCLYILRYDIECYEVICII